MQLNQRLLQGAAATVMLRTISAGLALLTYVLLARRLGIAEYGRFTYIMSWVWLLAALGTGGLDKTLVRYISTYTSQAAWDLLGGLLQWANQVTWLVCLVLGTVALGLCTALPLDIRTLPQATVLVVVVAAPLLVLMQTRQAALRGLHNVVLGQVPETLIQPVLLLAGVIIVGCAVNGRLTAPHALAIYVSATGAAFLFAAGFLHNSLPAAIRGIPKSRDTRAWISSAVPLLLVGGMSLINEQFDVLLLGACHGARAVSVYSVAKRGAGLIAFALIAANLVLAPTLASIYAAGERERLQGILTKSGRWVLLVTTLIAAGMIGGGPLFLGLFGREFVQGQMALTILILGQWINAAIGPVALLLAMTGHERDVAFGIGVSTGVNLLSNALLIPRAGVLGAAGAAAISMAVWNVLLAYTVRRRLGLSTTAWANG